MLLVLRYCSPAYIWIVADGGRHILPISILAYIPFIKSLFQSFLRDDSLSFQLLREWVVEYMIEASFHGLYLVITAALRPVEA
jgi:hypothetical protein